MIEVTLKIKTKIMGSIFDYGEKYYLQALGVTFLLLLFYMLSIQNSFLYGSVLNFKNIASDDFDGTLYPIAYVPDPFLVSYEQRKGRFEDIATADFVKIPQYNASTLLENPDNLVSSSQEYKDVVRQRLVYTVPYMGSYNMDYQEYAGSHPGVDIVAPKGTPIQNIANGVVVDVGSQPNGFGNYALVRHDNVTLDNGKKATIYALYAHMDRVDAVEGNKIKKGEKIGVVGDSGTATTPHLHFQMDLDSAPYSPYWPFTSADMKNAGVSFFGGVSIGLGRENALLYTINPLNFVNKNLREILVNNDTSNNTTQAENQTPQTSQEIIALEKSLEDDILLLTSETQLQLSDKEDFQSIEESNPEESLEEIITNDEENTLPTISPELPILPETPTSQDPENNIENYSLFSDIPDSHPYYDIFYYFKNKEIIKGFSDGTFRPKNTLTRIEAFKIMFLSFGKSPIEGKESQFQDVATKSWENGYVNIALELGIVDSTNTQFFPLREISKVEALKILVLLSGVTFDQNYTSAIEIADIPRESWMHKYVAYAITKGYIQLDEKNNFSPNEYLNREDFVKMVFNFTK